MEITTNNSTPLYKILDEQRSAGIWKAEESSNEVDYMIMAEDSQMPIIVSTEDGVAPQYQNKERAKANIEYAVLASNNLANVANCLSRLMTFTLKQSDEHLDIILNDCEDALTKIS